jgi:hypothetical protein
MSIAGAGLSLDIIGAFLTVFGLFRHPAPLTLGWTRDPLTSSADRAFGTVGGLWLVSGFVLQIIGTADSSPPLGARCTARLS